jgi:CheY-like chemotaxis protein
VTAINDKPTVLVMDDDDDVRFIAGIMLNRIGFNTVFAECGSEAVELYTRAIADGHPFHAVILDLNIPGKMGGEEAVKILKKLDPDLNAYVSCGNPYDPVMEDPPAFGFKGAIPKPFLPEHIQILLEK